MDALPPNVVAIIYAYLPNRDVACMHVAKANMQRLPRVVLDNNNVAVEASKDLFDAMITEQNGIVPSTHFRGDTTWAVMSPRGVPLAAILLDTKTLQDPVAIGLKWPDGVVAAKLMWDITQRIAWSLNHDRVLSTKKYFDTAFARCAIRSAYLAPVKTFVEEGETCVCIFGCRAMRATLQSELFHECTLEWEGAEAYVEREKARSLEWTPRPGSKYEQRIATSLRGQASYVRRFKRVAKLVYRGTAVAAVGAGVRDGRYSIMGIHRVPAVDPGFFTGKVLHCLLGLLLREAHKDGFKGIHALTPETHVAEALFTQAGGRSINWESTVVVDYVTFKDLLA